MRYFKNGLTKWHLITFVVMLGVFMILTFLITNAGVDEGLDHNARVLETTLGTITGPLTGAISRGFQRCCLEFSLRVMLYRVQPSRYSRRMKASASGQPVALRFLASQSSFLPVRRATLHKRAASVSAPE